MTVDTPPPPYYVVIFTAHRTEGDKGYSDMSDKMHEKVKTMPGFLGVIAAKSGDMGISISYWKDLESIAHWRKDGEHTEARGKGREMWYANFKIRIAKVEREYGAGITS